MEQVLCERNSSYSFRLILLKFYSCFNTGLKMCMWFIHNLEIIFFHFIFYNFNLDFVFQLKPLVFIVSSYLVSTTPLTVPPPPPHHPSTPTPHNRKTFFPQSVCVSLILAIHLNPRKEGRHLFSFRKQILVLYIFKKFELIPCICYTIHIKLWLIAILIDWIGLPVMQNCHQVDVAPLQNL